MPSIARRATQHVLHWACIPVIAVATTLWPTLSSGLENLQTNPGDTLLNLYFLEHAYAHFTGPTIWQPDKFWSPDFFWPIRGVLAWSDHLLGPSVIFGTFRAFLDPYQSYAAWLSTTLWLNYVSIRLAISKISPETHSIWLSIAALATSFSPTIVEQLGHPQLLSLFLIGPVILQCHRLISQDPERFTWSDWLLLLSLLLANGFFNIYIFVYACYGVVISSAVHLVRWRRQHNSIDIKIGKHIWLRIAAFSSCLALNLYIYIPYLQTIKTFGGRPESEIINNLPKPASWLYGTQNWLLPAPFSAGHISPDWVYGVEQEIFPGWSLCILLAAAIITAICRQRKSDQRLIIWLVVLGAMIAGTLCIHNISLWPLIRLILPGSSSLRASSRVALVIVLFAAPAIALAAQYWKIAELTRFGRISAMLALSASFAGAWGVNQPRFSLREWKHEMDTLSEVLLKTDCGVFWYEWKNNEIWWRAQVVAMHAQITTGIATANGYSGQFPRDNWPHNGPRGQDAFAWIVSSHPERYHSLRLRTETGKWCIASIDKTGVFRIKYITRPSSNQHS